MRDSAGHLIGDILVLSTDLGLCNFSFVKRIDNLVAHFLARKAVSGNELQVWINSTLDDIAPLVTPDSL